MKTGPKIIKRGFFPKDLFYNGVFDGMYLERRKASMGFYDYDDADYDDADYEDIDNTSKPDKYHQYPGK
ncbi:hypothetical protein ACFL20_02605 [Spirochaetota bacterium]